MKPNVHDRIVYEEEMLNVKIVEGVLQVTCPSCQKVNELECYQPEKEIKFSRFLKGGDVRIICEGCEAEIELSLQSYDWYVTCAVPPTARSGVVEASQKKSIKEGSSLCGVCGALIQNEDMYFVERTYDRYLGPMCQECVDNTYDEICRKKQSGYIRMLPFNSKFRMYPILYTNREVIKAQCPYCLIVNPAPSRLFEPDRENGDEFEFFLCPNCMKASAIAFITSGEFLMAYKVRRR
jgi:hypothetical protein